MADIFPKFILLETETGLRLVFGKVTYHKDLAKYENGDVKILGGGIWRVGDDTSTICMSGRSYDFGAPSVNLMKKCVDGEKIYDAFGERLFEDKKFIWFAEDNTKIDLSAK